MIDQHDIIKIADCLQTIKYLQCRAIIFFIALFIIVCVMQRKIGCVAVKPPNISLKYLHEFNLKLLNVENVTCLLVFLVSASQDTFTEEHGHFRKTVIFLFSLYYR